MKQLDDYMALRAEILGLCGYDETGYILPLCDVRGYYWRLISTCATITDVELSQDDSFPEDKSTLCQLINTDPDAGFSDAAIYWGDDYTLIEAQCSDGNQLLLVCCTEKERPEITN